MITINIKGWSELNVFVSVKKWKWHLKPNKTVHIWGSIFESLHCRCALCGQTKCAFKKLLLGRWQESGQNYKEKHICVPLLTAYTKASETCMHLKQRQAANFNSFWIIITSNSYLIILATCIKYTIYQSRLVSLIFFLVWIRKNSLHVIKLNTFTPRLMDKRIKTDSSFIRNTTLDDYWVSQQLYILSDL